MEIAYKISPTLNPNKVFLVKNSEIEKRLDPSWYVYLRSVKGFKFNIVALKKLLIDNPQYGANEVGIERKTNTEARYIRITDINDFGELENELGKTATTIEEKYFLKENDLLLARSGNTVGKSYMHKDVGYNCFFAGYMIRFKIDSSKVLPKYIFAYTQTNLYKKWIKAIQRTTGQPNINAEEYKSLDIPLPNTLIQEEIVRIYFDCLNQKQQNEAEAERLLASIDDYLLNELGIELPIPIENTLKSRMFINKLSDITGNRFDPYYHQIYFHKLLEAFNNSIYPKSKLGEHINEISYGASFNNFYVEKGIPLLRIKDLRRNDIIVKEVVYLPESAKDKLGNCFVHENDFLISRSGTIGVVAIVPKEIDGFAFGSFMIKFNLKNSSSLNKEYLSYFLNCKLLAELIERNKIGAIQGNITIPTIKSLPLILPPLNKQKEITDHITGIRKQAQELKDKTKEALAKASQEIEKILIG